MKRWLGAAHGGGSHVMHADAGYEPPPPPTTTAAPGNQEGDFARGITPWAKRVRSGMDGDTGCANTVQLYGGRGEKEGFVGFGLAASRRQSFLQRQHLACAAVHGSIDSPTEASFRLIFLMVLFFSSFSPSETADGG